MGQQKFEVDLKIVPAVIKCNGCGKITEVNVTSDNKRSSIKELLKEIKRIEEEHKDCK